MTHFYRSGNLAMREAKRLPKVQNPPPPSPLNQIRSIKPLISSVGSSLNNCHRRTMEQVAREMLTDSERSGSSLHGEGRGQFQGEFLTQRRAGTVPGALLGAEGNAAPPPADGSCPGPRSPGSGGHGGHPCTLRVPVDTGAHRAG